MILYKRIYSGQEGVDQMYGMIVIAYNDNAISCKR